MTIKIVFWNVSRFTAKTQAEFSAFFLLFSETHFGRLHGILRGQGVAARIFQDFIDFRREIDGVFEMPVNAGEADIRDLVQFPQIIHDPFADEPALDFRFEHRVDVALDFGDERRNLGVAHGPFPAGRFQSLSEFFPVEGNTMSVFFHDPDRRDFDPFVGRKALPAIATSPSAANDIAVVARSRIQNTIVILMTNRTFHGISLEKTDGTLIRSFLILSKNTPEKRVAPESASSTGHFIEIGKIRFPPCQKLDRGEAIC